jgi:hypothetical protein
MKFNGTTITFVEVNGVWCVPAKLIGLALGYAGEGQKLADAITGGWNKKWTAQDYFVLTGEKLKVFGQENETPEFRVSSRNSLLLLTPSGVVKTLQRSRAGLALEFRDFLAKNYLGVFKELTSSLKTNPKQMDLALKAKEDAPTNNLGEIMKIVEMASKRGLMTKKEQKLLYAKVLEIKMQAFTQENKVTHFLPTDGTIPPSSLLAMTDDAIATSEGKFRILKSNERHPAYMLWKSAEDIGRPYGLKADLVKASIKTRCNSAGFDLPNNIARSIVRGQDNFMQPDSYGFLTFTGLVEKLGGIAIYSATEDGQMVWRNFWSPEAVTAIEDNLVALGRIKQKLVNGTVDAKTIDASTIENLPQEEAETPTA